MHKQAHQRQTGSDGKQCSYCKKHGNTYTGNIWQDCPRLKRDQQCKKNQANNQPDSSTTTDLIAHAYVAIEQHICQDQSRMDIDSSTNNCVNNFNRIMEL